MPAVVCENGGLFFEKKIKKMDKRFIIGIDPGKNGGIAVYDIESADMASVEKMPETPLDILSRLRLLAAETVFCVLEDVGQGIPGQSSRATATFARHNGHLEMALLALGIKAVKVRPQKWERAYSLGKSADMGKQEWKRRLKAKAQELFPELGKKITLATCDAILLAYYGYKTYGI